METQRPRGETPKQCGYCGLVHGNGQKCPAFGKKCMKCPKMNHFAAVCRTKSDNGKVEKKTGKPRKLGYGVKKTTTTEYDDSTSSDDEFIVEHLEDVKKIQEQGNYRKTVILRIDDVDMRVEPNSGAGVNLMDEHQFKALVHRSNKKITLEASQTRLNTLQGDL